MKLLLDANLSWRLANQLKLHFTSCIHVEDTGMKIPATDAVKGFPPKVIFLRTGNQSNNYLLPLLIKHKKPIQEFSYSAETGVLEIFNL